MDSSRTRQLGAAAGGGLEAFLRAVAPHRRVTLDTCACVFFLSSASDHHGACRALFLRAAKGDLAIDLGGITYLELLVMPFQTGNREDLQTVLSLLKQQAGVEVQPLTETVLMAAAMIRANTGLKVPDSLVIASAAVHGSTAIIGNDSEFKRVGKLGMLRMPLGRSRPIALPEYIHLGDYADTPVA